MEQGNHNSQFSTLNSQFSEFDEIRPYESGEMKQAFNDLLNDRQFSVMLKGFVPWLPKSLRNGLLKLAFIGIKTPLDFQKRFMKPNVWHVIHKHTDGTTSMIPPSKVIRSLIFHLSLLISTNALRSSATIATSYSILPFLMCC